MTPLLTGEAISFTTSSSSTGENSFFAWNVIKNAISAALTGKNLAFSTVSWTYTIGLRKLVRFSMCVPEFATFHGHEKKSILLHNLDPMFNIKSGFFFQSDGNAGFIEQVERFSVFDTDSITKYLKIIIMFFKIIETDLTDADSPVDVNNSRLIFFFHN